MSKTTHPNEPRRPESRPPPAPPHAGPPYVQRIGTVRFVPLGLSEETRAASVEALTQILATSTMLRDLYKKCHWQVSGPTFFQLHLLFDKHYETQVQLVDAVAERVQLLGGVSIALADDIADRQTMGRLPTDVEDVPTMLARLVDVHMHLLQQCRKAAKLADQNGDVGTNDLLVSELVRTNEMQSWFVNEHRVAMPLVREGTPYGQTSSTDGAPQLHS